MGGQALKKEEEEEEEEEEELANRANVKPEGAKAIKWENKI